MIEPINDSRKDADGYILCSKELPEPFDLTKFVDGNGDKHIGWWTGQCWDGKDIEDVKEVVKWKRWLR